MPHDRSFSRLDATRWRLSGSEPDGLSEHPWLERPNDDRLWLYKPVEIKAGNRQGEDWAEKVVSEVGSAIGVPCARTELAVRFGRAGSVSRDVRPSGWDIQPGAALLDGYVNDYESRTRLRTGHSLDNIERVLATVDPPPANDCPDILSAYDVFCGYLMLDALVANRERHDYNWAIVIPPRKLGAPALSPTYDHASSLGFNLLDERRGRMLRDGSVAKWAEGGTAWRFEHEPPPATIESLVELAVRGLVRASDHAQEHWIASLSVLTDTDIHNIIDKTPDMSELASTFASELLRINRQRLLRLFDERRSGQ